jgi:hypothetical protein
MSLNRMAIPLLLLATMARAQQAAPDDRQVTQQLMQQVKDLQERVLKLESQRCVAGPPDIGTTSETLKPSPVAPPTTPPGSPPQETVEEAQASSFSRDMHNLHGLEWRGFGEVDYMVFDQKNPGLGPGGFVPGSAGNFYLDDFDLLLTANINDKAHFLSEVIFGEDDAQSFDVELQRMLFEYDFNDHVKASFGRYHTGIGYYNADFLSGTWQETMADRPLIVDYAIDGGPLPTQAIGLSTTGAIPSGKLGLHYLAEYGSSDTIRPTLDGIGSEDENNGNQINFGLFARPESVPGMQIGASIYHDRISDFTRGPSVRLGQTIANVHGVYVRHGIEFLNEGFLIQHAYEKSPLVFNMPAFYSQASKRFGPVRPYFRYQYINANPGSLFKDISLRRGPSVGMRYDFNENFAFKTQFDHTARKGQPDLNALHLQLAFTF